MTREEAIIHIGTFRAITKDITKYRGKAIDKAFDMAINALKQESCEDAISRQAVLDLAKKGVLISNGNYESVCKAINELPPVNPQPKTGHWIEQIDYEENCRTLICSNCDRPALHDEDSIWKHKFCPHCGAKMIEPQESEDKCKNCEYYRNPDYTRCHECEAESEG